MDCCQIDAIEEYMDVKMARAELKGYRSDGPANTTRILLDGLRTEQVLGSSLLDIGGGVGAIQHEFLRTGSVEVTSVDASSAYLEAAREEASLHGHGDRLQQLHGDFVKLANDVPMADVVTLDRVICCFDDMESLVRLSAKRAKRLYGLVYPRDHVFSKVLVWLENAYHLLRSNRFRAFVHATESVDELIRSLGFERIFARGTMLWQVHIYRRSETWPAKS